MGSYKDLVWPNNLHSGVLCDGECPYISSTEKNDKYNIL